MLQDLLPEFLNYWFVVGWDRFIRVFWYFLFFEFFRYVLVDYIVLLVYFLKRKSRKERYDKARAQLRSENPLISIICPGKNEGKHLYYLSRSLNEQTYQNFELIVVDDGSDDQTYNIGRDLQKRGFIHKYIRNEMRGGKASAANTALQFARGKYVVHIDADCSFDRDAIENIIVPFYLDEKIGAVGGNVKVRNSRDTILKRFQALKYMKTISVGRIVTTFLGIYKIVSGAFGAFKPEVLKAVGGWDIGPGLDGDITVKFRKSGFKIHFENTAVCLTSVPDTPQKLIKQRLRWDKSIIRFRLRKHVDLYLPYAHFKWSNFFSVFENVFYNVILDITWFLYLIDMLFNYTSQLDIVILTNIALYVVVGFLQFFVGLMFSERPKEELSLIFIVPFMTIYTGWFLRIIRTTAYYKEIFFKASYKDNWNPVKSSQMAKRFGL